MFHHRCTGKALQKYHSGYSSLANPASLLERLPTDIANDRQPDPISEIRCHLQELGVATAIRVTQILQQRYPNHVVVQTQNEGIIELANAGLAKARLDTDSEFYVQRIFSKDNSDQVGRMKDTVQLARFNYHWNNHDFYVYQLSYSEWGYLDVEPFYILYPMADANLVDGRSQVVDELITAAAKHANKTDKEIWVYDKGYWRKNSKLWKSVQACKWSEVILHEEMKANLVADVEGFFDRREDYKSFGVPWKRGIILHGLPDNGKTISIKALMRSLSQRSPEIPTLYVKSLGQSVSQDDIRSIFDKARETAPSLLVFEDIDSLVSGNVKSFCLNEVDDLEGNDGVMMIGSTNYCGWIDWTPGLPSDQAALIENTISLCQHMQNVHAIASIGGATKLAETTSMQLPPELSSAIAKITEGSSFAYLQEALVTALLDLVQSRRLDVSSANHTEAPSAHIASNPIFRAIKKQVEILRKEMLDSRKSVEDASKNSILNDPH
ncbi:MAG: hypothetical protein Q9226_000469 [Calogaya cf. arnoldii]